MSGAVIKGYSGLRVRSHVSLTLLYERKRKAARCSRVKSNVKRKMKDVRNTVLDQDSILFHALANDGEEGRR